MQNASSDFIFLRASVIYSKTSKNDFGFEIGCVAAVCIVLYCRSYRQHASLNTRKRSAQQDDVTSSFEMCVH